MVSAVAVKDIDGIDGIKLMLLCISAVCLGYARIKAAAEKGSKTCLLELFLICPLPAVIEISRESLLLASLLVYGSPLGIVRILRLVISGIHVIDAADEACVHDYQILIRKRYVHDQVRLIRLDEVNDFLNVVCIDLRSGNNSLCLSLKCFCKRIALRFCTACDTKLSKNIICLAALSDSYACNSAASDNQYSAHFLNLLFNC